MKMKVGKKEGLSVILYFKNEDCPSADLKPMMEKEILKGELGEIYTLLEKETIYLGLGERAKLNAEKLKKAFFKLGRELNRVKATKASAEIPKFEGLCIAQTHKAVAEGLLQSEYRYDKFLSEKKPAPTMEEFYFVVSEDKAKRVEEKLEEVEKMLEGVFFARDLVNEPAMYMTPTKLAQSCVEMLSPLGVEVEVFDRKQIEELGMKAFLAVARGSAQEPKFIVMKWEGDKESEEKIALVGKGLTYDSGGYCIKPPDGMATMHCDMGGAGSVAGVMMAVAKNKLKKNVVGVVAACENMISGDAYKTGDIIRSMKGLSIEIGNTDAEGRLTLADALYYAATVIKPSQIVDVATLTGACVMALGSYTSGAVTNNKEMMESIVKASERSGDAVWELPANDLYRDMLKGSFGDLKNAVKGGAGTITAGLFLEKFVEEIPWVHLDIAGTAYLSKAYDYLPEGATGAPVRLLYYFLKHGKDCAKEEI
ncbi:MAG: leucyl aminopeptidase [Peptostreptococcaceae bacterium]|nr:leucyl aminopeptidase [Peptostreptococcaceae bacterium]